MAPRGGAGGLFEDTKNENKFCWGWLFGYLAACMREGKG
jgi:hypothetical protein